MSAASDEHVSGTSGVIHIECRKRGDEPSKYLLSFGGDKDGVGIFYLAKVTGVDPLTALLRKLSVPAPAIETALHVQMAEARHNIPNVTLTKAMLRNLGL